MQRRCSGTRKDGQPCGSFAWGDSSFCTAHDPTRIEQQKRIRAAGGASRSNAARSARAMVEVGKSISPEEVPALLTGMAIAVLSGEVEPRQASAFATCLRTAVVVQESALFAARLEELDRLVRMLGGPTDDTI